MLDPDSFEYLRDEAESLGWTVWSYDVISAPLPGHVLTDIEKLTAPRERVCMLRAPDKTPFVNGEPAKATSDETATLFTIPKRGSEIEAWHDLPPTLAKLRKYSRRLF